MKNMKQLLISIFLCMGLILTVSAQNTTRKKPTSEQLEKIKQAHIAFVSSRVTISSDQGKKFWPIYNEFHKKRQNLKIQERSQRRDLRKHKMKEISLTESQINEKFNKIFDIKQQVVVLEKNYHTKFIAILTINQLLELYKVEKEFLRTLRKRVGTNK